MTRFGSFTKSTRSEGFRSKREVMNMAGISKIKIGIAFIFCFLIHFIVCVQAFGDTIPQEVMDAGKDGLHVFLERIPPNELVNYGFSPEYPIAKANVNIPFRVYTITPASLFNYRAGDTVSSLISPTGMWYFPVIVNNSIRAILTVARLNGVWQAVALGQAALARELGKMSRQWPRSKGYAPLLIMVFQAKSYFFSVPQKDDFNLTPFVFEGKAFRSIPLEGQENYATPFELKDIIKELKNAVEENIR